MLKVLLVDDEYYFREALKVTIEWEKWGFEICGEAKNGKIALEKMKTLQPDIVIVDINMPIMDGLEFLEVVKTLNANVKVIILTGHSEFNYAKQAVHLGVINYILKPIEEKELLNTLLDIKDTIKKESNIKVEVNKLKRQVKKSKRIMKEKFINDLIQGNIIMTKEGIFDKFKYFNMNIKSEVYQICVVEIDAEEHPEWSLEDRQLWIAAVSNIISELLADNYRLDITYDNLEYIILVIGHNNDSSDIIKECLIGALEQVKEIVNKLLNFTITIGIGGIYEDVKNISVSYKEALVAIKSKTVFGNDKIILHDDISQMRLTYNFYTMEHRRQILMNMRVGKVEEVNALIKNIFTEMKERNIHPDLLLANCVEMFSTCLEFMAEMGEEFYDDFENYSSHFFEDIQSQKSINHMEQYIIGIFNDLIKNATNNKNNRASEIVKSVLDYIHDNYSDEDLNIGNISNNLFVNYGHLCYVFKKEIGKTINEYITSYRMSKAKKMIEEGNCYVMDVASRVGYSDANYFGKCFKKRYGISPSKYIEDCK